MKGYCKHEGCYSDTTCALGHIDRNKCEFWIADQDKTPEKGAKIDISDIPWNSYALGTNDLAILASRGKPIVVGLIGAENSGKTTLLSYIYMWLLKYGKLPNWIFCGSWTLGSWEAIVQGCRWSGDPPPTFPPHTTSSGRIPSLLHLSLRNKENFFRDILFTDAPGEWFTSWAKSPYDESTAGARWIIEHSDVLLLLIDQDALANDNTLPQARRNTRDLIERVGAVVSDQPIGFSWTKTDIKITSGIKRTLEQSRDQFAPHSVVLGTTITKPRTIATTLSKIINLGEKRQEKGKLIDSILSSEPFLAMRNYDVRS